MKAYIARQPIYNTLKKVAGYELLYRDEQGARSFSATVDGSEATRSLLANAVTTFGMERLTNGHPAFVNFTRPLLLSNVPALLNPADFVLEILEDVEVDDELLSHVEKWRSQGYRFALDDYIGSPDFIKLLPLVDIVKVDFRLASPVDILRLAKALRPMGKQLLAEKVETMEEYALAYRVGFTMFQGYYFEKPALLEAEAPRIQSSTYLRIFNEAHKEEIDFQALSFIIQSDATLAYQLLRYTNSVYYFRKRKVTNILHALTRMGAEDMRKWVSLVFLRGLVSDENTEIAKSALVRAILCEKAAAALGAPERGVNAYLVGIFSTLDLILGNSLSEILEPLNLDPEVAGALMGQDNLLRQILLFAQSYERGDWDEVQSFLKEHKLSGNLSEDYLEAVRCADAFFEGT